MTGTPAQRRTTEATLGVGVLLSPPPPTQEQVCLVREILSSVRARASRELLHLLELRREPTYNQGMTMLPTPRARLTGEAANYKPGTSVEVRFGEQWVPGRVHEVRSVGVGFCPIVVKTENGTLLHCKIGPDLRLPLDN